MLFGQAASILYLPERLGWHPVGAPVLFTSLSHPPCWGSSFREKGALDFKRSMSLIPDSAVVQKRLDALPLVTYQAGENLLTAGSRTGRLLILKKGAVAIIKGGIEIAKEAEPGAVFGEISALLDQPHAADVRTLETSEFHVADAATLLVQDPVVILYVAAVLARRLDTANQALIELKRQVQAGEPPSEIGETIDEIEGAMYRYFRLFM